MTERTDRQGYFLPGKTAQQVKDDLKRREAKRQNDTVSLTMNVVDAGRLVEASNELSSILAAARSVFDLLRDGHASGWLDQKDISGLLELCDRGIRSIENDEGRVVQKMAGSIKDLLRSGLTTDNQHASANSQE